MKKLLLILIWILILCCIVSIGYACTSYGMGAFIQLILSMAAAVLLAILAAEINLKY